jgi:hypothetical protein
MSLRLKDFFLLSKKQKINNKHKCSTWSFNNTKLLSSKIYVHAIMVKSGRSSLMYSIGCYNM